MAKMSISGYSEHTSRCLSAGVSSQHGERGQARLYLVRCRLDESASFLRLPIQFLQMRLRRSEQLEQTLLLCR